MLIPINIAHYITYVRSSQMTVYVKGSRVICVLRVPILETLEYNVVRIQTKLASPKHCNMSTRRRNAAASTATGAAEMQPTAAKRPRLAGGAPASSNRGRSRQGAASSNLRGSAGNWRRTGQRREPQPSSRSCTTTTYRFFLSAETRRT